MTKKLDKYVLVTPVKNEETTLGQTIQSVVLQTVRPVEWVIVSDGSTDRTNQIVREAAAANPWIRLLTLSGTQSRSFASVVNVTTVGIQSLTAKDYQFLGLLDADVSFQADYFERLLGLFSADTRMGVAGGVVIDVGLPRDQFPINREEVPGAVQLFRRECFESLGGLLAIPEGGWDTLTCARARMNGYRTGICTDLVVDHLKPRNIGEGGLCRRTWQLGVRDYAMGYGVLFEMVKCLSRLCERPVVFGSIARWFGYCSAVLKRLPRQLPPDLLNFMRSEQASRLRRLIQA